MNKTAKIIVGALALAALIGGAALLYNKLAPQYEPDALTPSSSAVGENSAQGNENAASTDESAAPTDENGEPLTEAYDFTVTDAEGNEVSLASLRGKPVVINFWATWCGYCRKEMPDFDAVYSEYGDRVEFMIVNMTDEASGETAQKAAEYLRQKGYAFPAYYDTLGEAAAKYKPTGLPTTVVVDEKGYFYGYATGMISGDVLRKALDEAIELYE